MRRHSSERSMKRCWKWKRTVYARQAGALWKANACLLKNVTSWWYTVTLFIKAARAVFQVFCWLLADRWKGQTGSEILPLGKPESEQVCSSRCVKYGAISHPMAAHFLYFQTISQSRRPCTEWFFFLLNVLTLGSVCFCSSCISASAWVLLLHCNKDNRRSWTCLWRYSHTESWICLLCCWRFFLLGEKRWYLERFFRVWPEAAGRNLSVASCPVGVGLRWRPLPASSPGGRYHLSSGPGWRGGGGGAQWSAAVTVKTDLSSEVTVRLCEISVSASVSAGGSRQARGPRLSSPLQKFPPQTLTRYWELRNMARCLSPLR